MAYFCIQLVWRRGAQEVLVKKLKSRGARLDGLPDPGWLELFAKKAEEGPTGVSKGGDKLLQVMDSPGISCVSPFLRQSINSDN